MQSKVQRVVVLGTGGTIAGVAATPEDDLDYVAGQVGVGDLVTAARDIADIAAVVVETEQLAQCDSKDMDFATWRWLALRIASHAARPEVAGVVVTHGTDTLEETAYFLSRVLVVTKPVVLTAAMRPATSAQADGPRNLADAIAVASRSEIAGVVVVIAGEVHAARDVRKAHTHRLAAFTSGERGPMARIEGGHATLLRDAVDVEAQALAIERLPAEDGAWPWVEIVTSDAGADGRAVEALRVAGVDGIVVAATGNGTVHGRLQHALRVAEAHGTAVVRSSRCLDGGIVDGAAAVLASAADLTPVKARIELILSLLAQR